MNLCGQEDAVSRADSLPAPLGLPDSTFVDFSLGDTIPSHSGDSIPPLKYVRSKDAIEKTVTYSARDSIIIAVKSKKAYLYYEGYVLYDDIELKADYIEIDFQNNELYASGIANEEGEITGHPLLIQDGIEIRAQELKYNFTTRKGKISGVITSEGEGFIHGDHVKKFDEFSYIKAGTYTTCDLDCPHFGVHFNRAKMIPDDKIVTGVAYLSFGGIPTPLGIPFGLFPNKKGRSSGFIMPTFRESVNMGFAFEGFGYYFGLSDNIDLALTADIFTRGSWALKAKSHYVFRYKCNGDLELSFAQNFLGERYTPSFQKSNNFKVYWSHKQDSKSHPTTRFSAHVNFVTKSYNKYNPSSANDYLTNEYSSAMSLSSSIRNFFFFDAALSYKQNTQTSIVNIGLPTMSMSINQVNPFRRKVRSGSAKWYENITVRWNALMSNQINTLDSMLLLPETWRNMDIGMQHKIPVNIPIKLGKVGNWNTNIDFTERIYFQKNITDYSTITDTAGNETGVLTNVFDRGFNALHDLNISTSVKTKIYFVYQHRKDASRALRHVMTPEIGLSFRPALNKDMEGVYYNSLRDENVSYSYYSGAAYGVPSTRTQGLVNFSINNNVEIKVRSSRDSSGVRKIAIFDNLGIATSYDFLADSMGMNYLTINGRSTFFKRLNVSFSLNFDPYTIDENGKRSKISEWKANKRLFRFSSTNVNLGLSWTIDKNMFSSKKKEEDTRQETALDYNSLGMSTKRPDFSNPWSFTFNYNFNYNLTENMQYYLALQGRKYNENMVHTVALIGDFSLTKKWKIGFSTGYDIVNKQITYTSLDIYRDLHCWEMRFNWVPFGFQKGYSFTINVKASVLQDLKYNLKRDFRDFTEY
ncbi:hypothetical protein LJC68_08295 [Bacteroidales bacterium OttesenSCG-928-B11]|nr:hypothetical protein [Bacteroidales bacterium OttesenSCG-928-C03]MDL2312860.1 hypothetical protein [Bacteroidales bacterium OttesenSCG-928-B11]MDL2325862.1 hypothetical protein [Bacteroidales bacterium OttesenSCG-928-A14]